MATTRIVIVGGGFGGLGVAMHLLRSSRASSFAITLLDPSPVHVYTPWLYEIAAYGPDRNGKERDAMKAAGVPFTSFPDIRFRRGAMTSLQRESKHVVLDNGDTIAYDIVVLALGSVSYDCGIPGVREYAYDLKRLSDAVALRAAVARCVSAGKPGCIAVVGAGPNGAEFAAECAAMVHAHERRGARPKGTLTVVLFDALQNPLGSLSPALQQKARRRLQTLGVELRMNCVVNAVTKTGVSFQSVRDGVPEGEIEHIASQCTVMTLGTTMPDVVHALPFAKNPKGRIVVDGACRVQGETAVFALGDCAARVERGGKRASPQTAQVAIAQAEIVAQNILRTVASLPMRIDHERSYWDFFVALGGKYGVGTILGTPVAGYTAYILRRMIDVRYFFRILPWRAALVRVVKGVALYEENERA